MRRAILFLTILLCCPMGSRACTSAVISGKATADGRPLLWKNRDTDHLQNSVKYFAGGRYAFIGIVNSRAKHPKEVWAGQNSAGFAIMNTQSYNLEKPVDEDDPGPANGRILFKALANCATVADFCHFLDTIAKPSGIEANIGVIDAKGGAAMFEIGYHHYTMFDANDTSVAPQGYIVRTNFSFTGDKDQGAGYVRYRTADSFLSEADAASLTPQGIFTVLARSFVNLQLGVDLKDGRHCQPESSGWFVDQDFIPRHSTASDVVIQGVKPGESPELTTMWTILGYPPVSVAFPLWVKGADRYLPALLTTIPGEPNTPLGKKADALKAKVFSYHEGSGSERYLNFEVLYNHQNNGIMQQLEPVEAEVFSRTAPVLARWQQRGKIDTAEMAALYTSLSDYITAQYQTLFGL
ncbi:MAG: carcinine hydrolase/isopenicillin-N N-acyltransferase family protein [Prevotella sp.]|jgi:hypothetical protein|nr:carcinine hydrolase/isopenicillin-N N-acyltransferase family protein [Prevotella sp.]